MMPKLKTLFVVTALFTGAPVFAASDAILNLLGDPGFYGRLGIAGYPPPAVIYRQPVTVWPAPADRPPIYLRVPPGHAKHWSKHCREYNACGERVMFVQDNWYQREYAPRYQAQHRERRDEHRDERRGERRGERQDEHGNDRGGEHENDRRGNRQDHDRGRPE